MILIDPAVTVSRAALPKRELSRFLRDACEQVALAGEVTVLLATNERLRELNHTYRRKNKPTDVLSFPAPPPEFAGGEDAGGDLAISIETARRQAEALGHPLVAEVKILILHGLLHLAGMDHEQDTGAMGRRESRLRRRFGLPAGLIQRTAGSNAPLRTKRVSASSTSVEAAGQKAARQLKASSPTKASGETTTRKSARKSAPKVGVKRQFRGVVSSTRANATATARKQAPRAPRAAGAAR